MDLTLPRKLLRIQWLLVALVSLLAMTGVIMMYSVAGGSFHPLAERHLIRYLLALILFFTISLTDIKIWYRLAYPLWGVSILLLGMVLWSGSVYGGAQRWIVLGPVTLQPSELVKITLILALARYYHDLPEDNVSRPLALLLPLFMIGLPFILVLKQPDLGTAILIAGTGTGLMFLAGLHLLYFIGGVAGMVVAIPFIFSRLHSYQQQRILTFLNPERDPLGAGYHILQSRIAIGSGGLHGQGLGHGPQSQLNFLPEKHTDFIFTMLAEELGFIGAASLIVLLGSILITLWYMALKTHNRMSRLLIAGIGLGFFYYVFVNIAMVMGLLPVVGVPLPLVSYGGTAMLTLMSGLGLAMSAYIHRERRLH